MTFAEVVGHRPQTRLLARAIARETLPPTLLFVGPGGVGKYAVGQAVAGVLNCLAPVTDADGLAIDACGVCRACDRVARHVHVDVFTLVPDERTSIKIDEVRSVLARTGFRPFEGRRRVILIREAEALEQAAQNALLKSLEEPPPGTVFILTSAVPAMLLPTVVSRCMRLRFGRLTPREIETVLTRDHGASAGEAHQAAALANGSVGQALALASTNMTLLRETAMVLLRQRATAPASTRLQAAAVLAVGPTKKDRTREELGLILQTTASMLRDIELLNAGGDPQILANPGLADELGSLRRLYEGARARTAFAAVDRASVAIGRPHFAGIKVVSDWLAMQI